jgi:glycyl-tRNA synthetase beta chain
MNKSVLLEIGTEEIPARFLPGALISMKEIAEKTFNQHAISFQVVKTFATPRRLAVFVTGVPEKQDDTVKEVFGPPIQAAYDKEGSPTKAAIGFARSQGVDPAALVVKKKGKGDYVAAIIEEKGLSVIEVLPEALKEITLSLHFPKSMRWGEGSMRFVRPIHWITALFGKSVVGFEIDGIKSANISRGHRFLSPGEIKIKNAEEYLIVLEDKNVIADKSKRDESIRNQFMELCGYNVEDEELVSIVSDLVEYPVLVLGGFSEKYLKLPDELLTAVMKGHQKYFSVKDRHGKLINNFVVTSNTTQENADMVRAGAERVLRARFEDARFYFEDDRGTKLVERLEHLINVTFQEKLGTTYEKTMRIRAVSGAIADSVCPDRRSLVERAAELSKCDLITGVVREFPELQGIMGMYYAMGDSEDENVALALRDQYRPVFVGDDVPQSDIAAVLGLADRMDNIAAFFSIGLKPTGSEDPFALRRQALGVVSILIERGYDLSIEDMLETVLLNLGNISDSTGNKDEMLGFLRQRVEHILSEKGFAQDLIKALTSFSTSLSLNDLMMRIKALDQFRSHTNYNEFLTAIKRVRNILAPVIKEGAKLPEVNRELFKDKAENNLHNALISIRSSKKLEGKPDYAGVIDVFLRFVEPINNFFDEVLVMDKDEGIKQNRLSLLGGIWDTVSTLADFSVLREV